MNIIDIRIQQYLQSFDPQLFQKIIIYFSKKKIDTEKLYSILENILDDGIRNQKVNRDIGVIYLMLNRNIEALHFLWKMYEIDKEDIISIYHLNEVFSRRKSLFHIQWSVEQLESLTKEHIMTIKGKLKLFLISGRHNDLLIIAKKYIKYKYDEEFNNLLILIILRTRDLYILEQIYNDRITFNNLFSMGTRAENIYKKCLQNLLIHKFKRILCERSTL